MKLYRYAYMACTESDDWIGEVTACNRRQAFRRADAQMLRGRGWSALVTKMGRGEFWKEDRALTEADYDRLRREVGK